MSYLGLGTHVKWLAPTFIFSIAEVGRIDLKCTGPYDFATCVHLTLRLTVFSVTDCLEFRNGTTFYFRM